MNLDFQPEKDGVSRCQETVAAQFPVVIERHDREKFQRDGHFVPRMIDAEQRPREWDGPLVFVGIVFHEMRDMAGQLRKAQLLRVLADTPQELARLLDLRLRETFFALWSAQQVQSDQGEQVRQMAEQIRFLKNAEAK